jgi:hypothetical protein
LSKFGGDEHSLFTSFAHIICSQHLLNSGSKYRKISKEDVYMKGLTIMVAIIVTFCFTAVLYPAQDTDISSVPEAQNAGRIAKLTEVLRISDDGDRFFFKIPHNLKIGPDGSIYILDDKQHLKFDKNGTFIKNFKKTGEGPGEYIYSSDYQVNAEHIFIFASQPYKIIKMDLSGNLINETRLTDKRSLKRLFGFFGDEYYYLFTDLDWRNVKNGIVKISQELEKSNLKSEVTDLNLNFPEERYVYIKRTGNRAFATMDYISRTRLLTENKNSAFISHTRDYLITHLDPANGKIIRRFKRKYQPVKYIPKAEKLPEHMVAPRKEYNELKTQFCDIMGLKFYKDKLLVFTSTLDKKKGVLVDIFGKDGKYVDMVYFPLPGLTRPDTIGGRSFQIDGECLYIVEKDEEDNFSIAKYKIEL